MSEDLLQWATLLVLAVSQVIIGLVVVRLVRDKQRDAR